MTMQGKLKDVLTLLCFPSQTAISFRVSNVLAQSIYIDWLVQLGAVTVCCQNFGEKSKLVTQQGSMTTYCQPCLSCCLKTEESDFFGKPKVNFKEISDATRVRAKLAPITDIKYLRILSSGAYGKVYLVSDKQTGQYFAMKEVIKKKEIYLFREHNLEKEHTVMMKVQCPWTVELLNRYESPYKRCMLMEFLPGRNLLEELILRKKFPIKQIRVYAAEMLACLFSVHRHGYIHRDIKLSNFLLDSYNHIKLCDFGLCVKFLLPHECRQVYPPRLNFWEVPANSVQARRREIRDTHVHVFSTPHGTSYYCAPEVIKFTYKNWSIYGSDGYTFTCDFWSYGICLYYLLFGHLPFYSSDKLKIPCLIIYWRQTLNLKSKHVIPDSGLDLIQKLICEENSRLGADGFHEIACHSFFDNIRWEGLGYRRNPAEIPGPDILESPDSSEELESAWNNFLPFLCRTKQRRKTEYSLSLRRRHVSSQMRTEAKEDSCELDRGLVKLNLMPALQRERATTTRDNVEVLQKHSLPRLGSSPLHQKDERCDLEGTSRRNGSSDVTTGTVLPSNKPGANDLPVAGSKAASETETSNYRSEMKESSVDFEYLSIDPPRVHAVGMSVFHGGGGSPGREGRATETLSTSSSSPNGYITAQASLDDVKS